MVFLLIDLPDGRNMTVDSERIKFIVDHDRDTVRESTNGDSLATVHFVDGEELEIGEGALEVWKHASDMQAAEKQKVEEHVCRLKASFEQHSQDCQTGGTKPQSPLLP